MPKKNKDPKPRIGRPPKRVKALNPLRLQSRWSDESWSELEAAADLAGAESVVAWARPRLIRLARRELGRPGK